MPLSPPRPCSHPGCRELVRRPATRCPTHHKSIGSDYARRKAIDDKKGRHYYTTPEHREWRKTVLRKHPICCDCKTNPSTEADHIKPRRTHRHLALDPNNGIGRCKSCHSRRTAREHGGFGNPTKESV